jgi:hypothetical protein
MFLTLAFLSRRPRGKGYFIGSGVIESSNKTILQRRLKQAGMRWDPVFAQNILSLITKQESDLWEQTVANCWRSFA